MLVKKIGITGQSGFIGTHLFNFFGLKKEEIVRIPFQDNYFEKPEKLEQFVSQCDVVIHLAALNRHNDHQSIYETNILLVKKLISALENTGSRPHILFASSIQEERDNLFGKSKREGRELFARWADRNNAVFTGLIIPNVFGPFGRPYYNSVIATFCHQLTHNEKPQIEIDASLRLIYIGDLVNIIWQLISEGYSNHEYKIEHTIEKKVSELLEMTHCYKTSYYDQGIIPILAGRFEINLFNTFRCYMDIANHYPVKLTKKTDDRGDFVETLRTNTGGQVSFSVTRPGITRGNHFHTRKIERFAVISGKARIQLRQIGTDRIISFDIDGSEPCYVDMPIWYTHNITNTGKEDLYTLFWINEFFDPSDPDTFFEEV